MTPELRLRRVKECLPTGMAKNARADVYLDSVLLRFEAEWRVPGNPYPGLIYYIFEEGDDPKFPRDRYLNGGSRMLCLQPRAEPYTRWDVREAFFKHPAGKALRKVSV